MATNPQTILNQTVPVADQPTAQQPDPTASQINQTVPVSQLPGVGSSQQVPGNLLPSLSPFQQQNQLLSTAAPGQPTQPGLLALAQSPQAQPYYQLVPFMAALEQQPQITLPQYGDPALAGIQQKLLAQQQSNPALSGKQLVSPTSVLAKTQSPMSVGDFIAAAGQGLWQENIVQPVQDYINTWKRDPTQGLLETIGGVAVTAGLIGLEAITAGGATPFIFGALAALQAPNLIQSWGQEITNPSDQNLVRAVVSTGSAAIAVGSPVRAFKGMGVARNLLEAQINLRQDAVTADRVAALITGVREAGAGIPGIKTGAALGQQMETLDYNNVEALRNQLEKRGIDLADEGNAGAQLLGHAQTLEKLRNDVEQGHLSGDAEAVGEALGEIKKLGPELRSAMLSTAYHYNFLPSTPYAHVPLAPIQGIEAEVQQTLNTNFNAIYGMVRRMHSGIGLQGPSDMAHANIASIEEAKGLDRAAGTPYDTGNRIELAWQRMREAVGVKDDAQEEKILQALEEPEKWAQLSPEEQAYGQKLRDFFDSMTAGELKYGYIAHPLQGRVPYAFTGPALKEEERAQRILETQAERPHPVEPKPYGSRSRQWKMAVDELTGEVDFTAKTRSQILADEIAKQEKYEQTHEHRQILNEHGDEIRKWRRQYGQHKPTAKKANAQKAATVLDEAKQRLGDTASQLVQMKNSDLKAIQKALPLERELVTGAEAVRRAFRSHTNRMQRAAFGEALQVHSNMAVQKLQQIFKDLPMTHWGAAMVLPKFHGENPMPDVLPETVWEASGNIEDAARKMGYFPIHPGTGAKGDLNYHPALYGHGKLANEIAKATNQATSAEMQADFLNGMYKVGGVAKRFIMYNPVYHLLNVAGRAIAFVASDPAIAGAALKSVVQNPLKEIQTLHGDATAYADLMEESAMAGMVHATQWNVGDKVRRMLREEDGQPSFFGAVRTAVGALNNIHKDVAERGLWQVVDQLQLAGYLYSKQRFLEKGITEFEARQLAAQYANNLGGMVNPLYMSRLWRQLKGMVFFAPSYWSTFLHSLQSVMPGSARLSQIVNDRTGGRFAALASVPLRAIDHRSRIELVRAQRDWMVTYLAATAVSMDMMNVMFSGHHLWENEPGHEWDVDVTNMPGIGGTQTSPSGEVRRAYITSVPFFRQGVDVGNAIGLGHDWGFGHVFGDQTWQQQDAMHKASMAAGALLDGVRRTASTKIGQIPQVAYGLATGEELTSRIGQGTQVQIDRPLALASLAPGGYQFERMWKTYQQDTQLYTPGSPQYQQAQQQFQQAAAGFLPSMLMNQSGFPSVYHMGVEKPSIDDSKFDNWVTQRQASQQRLTTYSNEVFTGQVSPLEYARHKHEEQIKMLQLDADTWGSSPTPDASSAVVSSLSAAYTALSQQFGLDAPGLSDQDWFVAYDAFLPAWNQLLQSAPPATRAAWWEHDTAQWTDADYLEWEARELKDALAASIDGQGGNYIRAYQNQIFRIKPTLTVQQYTDLENADPMYSAYRTMLTSMGQTSVLGAFVSAFSSPYTKTYVAPQGTTLDEAQTLAQDTGQVVIRPEQAQAQAQRARQVATDQGVAQSGGQAGASPEFQQEEQAALQAAQTGIPENQ